MITPSDFVHPLVHRGFQDFTGVPCSFFQAAINYVIDQPKLRYHIVPNEGAALALASGSYLAGKKTALFIQNSGFGNLINPLTSLNMIYKIPVIVFMSGRAYGVSDEPQHEIIGEKMNALLKVLGVPFMDMPDTVNAYEKALDDAEKIIQDKKIPFFFLVRKNTIEEYAPEKKKPVHFPMKRIDAIRLVAEALSGDELVIATTGKPSRELFSVADRKGNFYMQGSMGHASSLGLGIALAQPEKKVVILDGDGALLMHLGALSAIGHTKPKNLFHIVLDNESYETTGDQDTTSKTTDFVAIAKACGFKSSLEVNTPQGLTDSLKKILVEAGPSLLRIKINRVPTEKIPRISSKYESPDITANFKSAVSKNA